jgi:hypothetical protein
MTTNQTIDGVLVPPELLERLEQLELAMPDAPAKNVFACWSCKKPVTMRERADADGNCPHCNVELDIEDWPFPPGATVAKPQGGPEALEVVGRQCFPSEAMKAIHGYRKNPWVDGDVDQLPSEPGLYRIEPLVRLSDVIALISNNKELAP